MIPNGCNLSGLFMEAQIKISFDVSYLFNYIKFGRAGCEITSI